VGGGLYIVFRPQTHIAEFARGLLPITNNIFTKAETLDCNFIKYYLPDFLWAFSFNCGLNALFNSKKAMLINGCVVFLISILWETAQQFKIISGTGDLIDIAMYLIAVTVILVPEIIISKKIRKG
jgi:hypothetical protein